MCWNIFVTIFFTMTEAQLKLNQLLPAQCSGSSCEQDNCWCKIKLRVETWSSSWFSNIKFPAADAIQLKMPLTLIQISTIPKIASTKASFDKCIANMFYFNIPFNLLFSNLIINGHYLLAPISAQALKANRQLAGSDSYQLTTIAIIDQSIIWL